MKNDEKQFLNELRNDTGPDFDFDKMEAALMARVSAETQRRKLRSRVAVGVGVLAMAAAAVLVVTRAPTVGEQANPGGSESPVATTAPGAGALESGSAVTITNGTTKRVLARGESVKRGDQLETSRAVFRASGRVAFSLTGPSTAQEPAGVARVSVTESDHPIVLALSQGAVEAQVDKVSSGEAFAVDVSDPSNTVRIAVHGTHLRVARDPRGHVTLDLTEGIVNVGRPPKSGSTYGTLVTAPAHVEFDVASLETSFTSTKDPSKVRAAEDLSPVAMGQMGTVGVAGSHEPQALPQVAPLALAQQPSKAVRGPEQAPQQGTIASPSPQSAAKDPGVVPAPTQPRVDARTAINDAIATCASEKLPNDPQRGANAVTVSLASTLSLRVGEDGYVQAARFEPPLDPEVQKCAAATIYKVHFDDASNPANRSVMLPIQLRAQAPSR